jgi:hypothetical protein
VAECPTANVAKKNPFTFNLPIPTGMAYCGILVNFLPGLNQRHRPTAECAPFVDNMVLDGGDPYSDLFCILYGGVPDDTVGQILIGGSP